MTKLKIINKTPLKSRPIPFIELDSKYFYWLEVNTEIVVDILREKDNHLEVKLLTPNLKNFSLPLRETVFIIPAFVICPLFLFTL